MTQPDETRAFVQSNAHIKVTAVYSFGVKNGTKYLFCSYRQLRGTQVCHTKTSMCLRTKTICSPSLYPLQQANNIPRAIVPCRCPTVFGARRHIAWAIDEQRPRRDSTPILPMNTVDSSCSYLYANLWMGGYGRYFRVLLIAPISRVC